MNAWLLITAGCIALFTSILITPIVCALARRSGLIDRPDAHRKIHSRATPLGGGIAILLAASIALVPAFFIPSATSRILAGNPRELIGILSGVIIICVVGLLDDYRGLRARYKLLGQCLAAAIVVISGLRIEQFSLAGQTWNLTWLAIPLTVFWLILCMNAMNLIDGADGLASTVGIVLFATIGAISVSLNNELPAYVSLVMCGALLGFLRYNLPPARIFLGDSGSMSIGFLAGSLAVHTCVKGAAAFAITAPLAMWVLPLLDVTMAVMRRKLTGRGLSSTDRLHLHHSLLNRGISNVGLLIVVSGLSVLGGLGAWLTIRFRNEWFAVFSAAAICGLLITTRLFGHVELLLARNHIASWGRTLLDALHGEKGDESSWSGQIQLQGNRDWDRLWQKLIEAGESLNCSRIRLDLNLPWMHEGFHGNWEKPIRQADCRVIRLEWPLAIDGRQLGTLSILGKSRQEQALWLTNVANFLDDFQLQLEKVYRELRPIDAYPSFTGQNPGSWTTSSDFGGTQAITET